MIFLHITSTEKSVHCLDIVSYFGKMVEVRKLWAKRGLEIAPTPYIETSPIVVFFSIDFTLHSFLLMPMCRKRWGIFVHVSFFISLLLLLQIVELSETVVTRSCLVYNATNGGIVGSFATYGLR